MTYHGKDSDTGREIRTNGLSGNRRQYFIYDYGKAHHAEIEVFDHKGKHYGVIDELTGQPIKPKVKDRSIRISEIDLEDSHDFA